MKKSTIAILIVVFVGLGYAYTYFQVKEAASEVFENAEAVDYSLENISLINENQTYDSTEDVFGALHFTVCDCLVARPATAMSHVSGLVLVPLQRLAAALHSMLRASLCAWLFCVGVCLAPTV